MNTSLAVRGAAARQRYGERFARRSLGENSLANLVCSAAFSLARHFSGQVPNSSHSRCSTPNFWCGMIWQQSKQALKLSSNHPPNTVRLRKNLARLVRRDSVLLCFSVLSAAHAFVVRPAPSPVPCQVRNGCFFLKFGSRTSICVALPLSPLPAAAAVCASPVGDHAPVVEHTRAHLISPRSSPVERSRPYLSRQLLPLALDCFGAEIHSALLSGLVNG
jgi:hypothetical protein